MDDLLKHYGVKGMKWGVIKTKLSNSHIGKTVKKNNQRIKEEVSSRGRELNWHRKTQNVNKMTTKEINQMATRVRLENDMKRLIKNNDSRKHVVRAMLKDQTLATAKDRQDYRRRGKMSDQELNRKVNRLRAKDALSQSINQASKEQIDLGKKVYNSVKNSNPTEIFNNPQRARDKVLKEAGFTRVRR